MEPTWNASLIPATQFLSGQSAPEAEAATTSTVVVFPGGYRPVSLGKLVRFVDRERADETLEEPTTRDRRPARTMIVRAG